MKLEFYKNRVDKVYTEDELQLVLQDYKMIIDVFIFMVQSLSESKIKDEYWRYFSEMLAIKFIYSANTITTIINDAKLKSTLSSIEIDCLDVSSLYTLMRKQIENYATFYYLYIQPSSKSIQEYRCFIYELAGLESRKEYEANEPEHKEQKAKDSERLKEILTLLKSNSFFLSLDESQQNIILNNKRARLNGWRKIIEESDLVGNLFKQSWLLFSNHAHSEYISILQLRDFINSPEDILSVKDLVINLAMVLISIFIKDFLTIYDVVDARYQSIPQDNMEIIEFFNGVGRKSIFNDD